MVGTENASLPNLQGCGHSQLTGLGNGSHPDPPSMGSRWPSLGRTVYGHSTHCLEAETGICVLQPRASLNTSSWSFVRWPAAQIWSLHGEREAQSGRPE